MSRSYIPRYVEEGDWRRVYVDTSEFPRSRLARWLRERHYVDESYRGYIEGILIYVDSGVVVFRDTRIPTLSLWAIVDIV